MQLVFHFTITECGWPHNYSHSGDIRQKPPPSTATTVTLQFTQSPAEDHRSGAGEESQGHLLKMILLAVMLASQCCVSAAAGGSAAGLERIDDCGTGCSQVKQHPDLESVYTPVHFLSSCAWFYRCETVCVDTRWRTSWLTTIVA